ncbi:hypothetical protein QDX21_03385 [Auritidibacter ignavus]|uniref:Uncharacterized protein n=1 Tax=Auritidibacter ignavus TaxID=678932 RepID=A0AAJ6DCV9_9MICC|nr:hypothetical protein [Auritidibacter ignavus]WGH93854.1 hypothetical protein QDX21_03385 [Auritidibacter ignavus]
MGRKLTQDEIIKLYQIFWRQIDIDRKPPVWALLTDPERDRIYQAFDQNITLEDRTTEQDGWERVHPGNVQFRPGDMVRKIYERGCGDYRYYQDWQDVVENQDGDYVTTENSYTLEIGDDDEGTQLYIKRKPVTHPDPDEHPVIRVLDADWPDDLEDNEKPVVYVANREERYYEGFLSETHEHTDILDPYEITCWEVPTGWEEQQSNTQGKA